MHPKLPEISAWSQTSNCLWCPHLLLAVYRFFLTRLSALLLTTRGARLPPGSASRVFPLKPIPPGGPTQNSQIPLNCLLGYFQSKSPVVAHETWLSTPCLCSQSTIPAAYASPCCLFFPTWLTEGGSHCLNYTVIVAGHGKNNLMKTPGVNKSSYHHGISLCLHVNLCVRVW